MNLHWLAVLLVRSLYDACQRNPKRNAGPRMALVKQWYISGPSFSVISCCVALLLSLLSFALLLLLDLLWPNLH